MAMAEEAGAERSIDVSGLKGREGIAKTVLEAGGCARCALRFAGRDLEELLWAPETAVFAAMTEAFGVAAPETRTPCCVCLGILSRLHDPAQAPCPAADDLFLQFSARGYGMADYKLETFLPAACTIREALMGLHIGAAAGAAPGAPALDVIPLKDYHKCLVDRVLRRKLPDGPMRGCSSLVLCLRYRHPETDGDWRQLPVPEDPLAHKRKRKRRDGHVTAGGQLYVTRALRLVAEGARPPALQVPPLPPRDEVAVAVEPYRESVYVAGEYIKRDRSLSQTPWLVDGAKRTDTSVEELLSPEVRAALGGCADVKFHSAGREDVDVRMLGDGRPFLLELCDAKRDTLARDELAKLQARVNAGAGGRVEARNLRIEGKDAVPRLARGADSKRKTYTCLVWASQPVAAALLASLERVIDLPVRQRTPVRVLHRRSLMTREKTIHAIRAERLAPHYFVIHLTTSAGTYVKEFVHGDMGRTTPSLGDLLGCETDILQLDVTGLVHDSM